MTVRHEHLELPFSPEAVRRARSLVRQCAAELSPRAIANAELLVSEIVTNAVMHGAPDLGATVVIERGELTVRITDGDPRVPTIREQAKADATTSGRGLWLVEVLWSLGALRFL